MKIAVIGSGIGGLATAVRLAAKGHDVTVFETNDYPGGKIASLQLGGYRFDMGPSLFTMPENVTDLFKAAGKNPSAYFTYRAVGESCRYFYPDGTQLTAWDDKERFGLECHDKLGVDPKVVVDFLKYSERLYNITEPVFLRNSLHRIKTYLNKETFESFLKLNQLGLTKSMNATNVKKLGHPKLVQLFNRFATYNGSNPYVAPAVLNVIPHLEFNIGTYFPDKGMVNIIDSIYQLAQDVGVKILFNSPVDRIMVDKMSVTGVICRGEQIAFDKVVSNMDIVPTYRKLMPDIKAPERTLKQERSTSAIIFYWGIKKQFPKLGLQNIFFNEDYKAEFDAMFEHHTVCDDPTIYLHSSSVVIPGEAPEGCMNWYILVNAPHNTGQNWDEIINRTRANVLRRLSAEFGENVEPLIEEESYLDPRKIESRTASYQGSLYGASSNGLLASFIRHPNFSQTIKGLYFCGGSVHPGGGIPLCLLSGKIVADILK